MRNYSPIILDKSSFISTNAPQILQSLDDDIKNSLDLVTRSRNMIGVILNPVLDEQIKSRIMMSANKKDITIERIKLSSLGIRFNTLKDNSLSLSNILTLNESDEYNQILSASSNYSVQEDFGLRIKFSFNLIFAHSIPIDEISIWKIEYNNPKSRRPETKITRILVPIFSFHPISDLKFTIHKNVVSLEFGRDHPVGMNEYKEYSIRIDKDSRNKVEIMELVRIVKNILRFEEICLDILLKKDSIDC
jgi:hypothetical protein